MSSHCENDEEVELIQLLSEELDELDEEICGVDLAALAEEDQKDLEEDDDDPGSLVDFVVADDVPLYEGSEDYQVEATSISEDFESDGAVESE